jgi:hypothetical protein
VYFLRFVILITFGIFFLLITSARAYAFFSRSFRVNANSFSYDVPPQWPSETFLQLPESDPVTNLTCITVFVINTGRARVSSSVCVQVVSLPKNQSGSTAGASYVQSLRGLLTDLTDSSDIHGYTTAVQSSIAFLESSKSTDVLDVQVIVVNTVPSGTR